MTRIGQGGALVKHEKGSVIPSRQEIIKDLIKYFFSEYGWDIAESLFAPISTEKLIELAKKNKLPGWASKQLPSGKTEGGGLIVLVLAALALGRRRRTR